MRRSVLAVVLVAGCHDGASDPKPTTAEASPPRASGSAREVDEATREAEALALARTTTPPAPVRGVVSRARHACAWLQDDRVLCWGADAGGSIGDGSEIGDTPEERVRPYPVPMLGVPKGLAAFGPGFGIDADGGALTWQSVLWILESGETYYDHRTTAAPWSLPPKGLVDVALASNFGCVLTREGQVRCAGASHGLGDGSMRSRATFGAVPLPGRAVALSAAGGRSCAVLDDGRVLCWGSDPVAPRDPVLDCDDGLGLGARPGPSDAAKPAAPPTQMYDPCAPRVHVDRIPVAIAGVGEAIDVELGDHGWGCAIVRGGGVSCWGQNDSGALGDGTHVTRLDARPVGGLRGPVVQLAGTYNRVCARLESGAVDCWGAGRNEPWPVTLVDDAIDLSLGDDDCVVRRGDGNVWCWGYREVAFGDDPARTADVPSPLHWRAP